MKKKLLASLFVTTICIATLFSGCGKSASSESTSDTTAETTTEETTDTASDASTTDESTAATDDSTGTMDEVVDLTDESGEFNNGDFQFTYDPEYISVFQQGDMITASFYNENVTVAGSNVITISKVTGADAQQVLIDQYGASEDSIYENRFGTNDLVNYSFIESTDSDTDSDTASWGSGLQLSDIYYTIQDGDDVIVIDEMRTLGDSEETETLVSNYLEEVLESFALCE